MRGLRHPPDDPDGPRGAEDGAPPGDHRLGDRVFCEDGPLREDVRNSHVAWPRAPVRDRSEARESPAQGALPQRRRRRAWNRRRTLRERRSAELGHAVHHPRQRRLRAGEGTGLRARETRAPDQALEWGHRIPIGVFYKTEHVRTFEERIAQRVPTYRDHPPALQPIAGPNGEPRTDLTRLLQRLTFKAE